MANEANGGLGLKPHALMYLLGHSDISTTMRHYVRSSDEDLRKAMECIA
jgi:integrase